MLSAWLESLPISTWVREWPWGFPGTLVMHVWAMAFIAGISLLLALGIFGFAPGLVKTRATRFLPITWTAFGLSLASGFVLLCTYPATVLASRRFYLKIRYCWRYRCSASAARWQCLKQQCPLR